MASIPSNVSSVAVLQYNSLCVPTSWPVSQICCECIRAWSKHIAPGNAVLEPSQSAALVFIGVEFELQLLRISIILALRRPPACILRRPPHIDSVTTDWTEN